MSGTHKELLDNSVSTPTVPGAFLGPRSKANRQNSALAELTFWWSFRYETVCHIDLHKTPGRAPVTVRTAPGSIRLNATMSTEAAACSEKSLQQRTPTNEPTVGIPAAMPRRLGALGGKRRLPGPCGSWKTLERSHLYTSPAYDSCFAPRRF